MAHCSSEIMRPEGSKKVIFFNVERKRSWQPRILYPANLSFKNEGETRPDLQEILKEFL